MGILNKLFGRNREEVPPAPEYIPPTHLRRNELLVDAFQDISAADAAAKIENGEVVVLDVRFEYEYREHHIPSALLIPLPKLAIRYKELNPMHPTLVVCEHGIRSLQACNFLGSKGFKTLYNMVGGMAVYPGQQEGAGMK